MKIAYLNTDLDLVAPCDLTPLLTAIETHPVRALSSQYAASGYATLETNRCYKQPETSISTLLTAIEALGRKERAIWRSCRLREFNIGYDCGSEPWAFNQGLSNQTLARIAAVGATLRWTLYPPEPWAKQVNARGPRKQRRSKDAKH